MRKQILAFILSLAVISAIFSVSVSAEYAATPGTSTDGTQAIAVPNGILLPSENAIAITLKKSATKPADEFSIVVSNLSPDPIYTIHFTVTVTDEKGMPSARRYCETTPLLSILVPQSFDFSVRKWSSVSLTDIKIINQSVIINLPDRTILANY